MAMKLSYRTTACIAAMMPWQHVRAGNSIATTQYSFSLSFTLQCATTCDPSLCTCISSTKDPASCATQLHSVCTLGGIDDCVPPSGINQFRALHCPYAACIVDGGSREECACHLYQSSCEMYGDEENMGYCVLAECCSGQSDDAGLGKCLKNGMIDGNGVNGPTLAPAVSIDQSNGGLSQNSFVLDDFILLDDDASELSSEGQVTWVLPPSPSPTNAIAADGSSSFVDSQFSLGLGFARFCSSNCDPSLCSCLTEKEDFSSCIPELYSTCRDESITQCVPDIMVGDFKHIYCPYSECLVDGWVEGKTPEQCSCERYNELCGLNGDDESCSISSCCSEQQTDEGKLICLAKNPTLNPTSSPITNPPTSRRPTTSPTPAPSTNQPSQSPSIRPSTPPTLSPVTEKPTNRPTSKPSEQPTGAPITNEPTEGPSGSPSSSPTVSPITSQPSDRPTSKPSEQPTEGPTGNPSRAPTVSPVTKMPSNKPTSKPSVNLTEGPSGSPSNAPTVSPVTNKPSNKPTPKPSVGSPSSPPTISPVTMNPTEKPTPTPSSIPTATTMVLSQSPSGSPSNRPTISSVTDEPTKNPTYNSRIPTAKPSQSPTDSPSSSPTTSPLTAKPTKRPTTTPPIPPTAEPTIEPSQSSSDRPSSQPTTSPVTNEPTRGPTPKPSTMEPTLGSDKSSTSLPTIQPATNDPTKQPSPKPSVSPTTAPVVTITDSATDSPTDSKDFGEKTPVYCPPEYDPLWSSSYAAGSQVEVNGTIYQCNKYPYSIYCSLTDYRPVYGNEYWEDAWALISPCVFTDRPTSSQTASPTTKEPTRQPTIPPSTTSPSASPTRQPTIPPSTTSPSASPSTNKPTKRPTHEPTNTPTTTSTSKNPTKAPSSNPIEPLSQSPNKAPTASPRVEVTSLVQFQMQTMTKIMNDYEMYGVFQPSCKNFLKMQLINVEPHVFDIDCKVANQQLFSQRMLVDSSLRRLNDLTSLLVDVEATGHVLPSENVTSASDVNFDDLVSDAFARSSEIFINSLKNKGDVAGIDTFDELYSVTSIEQVNDKSAISEGSGSNTSGVQTGALAAILVGTLAVVALVGALVFQVINREVDDDSLTDDGELDGVMGDLGISGFQSTPVNQDYPNVLSEDSANRNDNLTYAFSLENGIDSPNSLVSVSKPGWEEGTPPRVRREVIAPPGKLGIIIDTSSKGPIVHSVKDESVLEGLVFAGDLIIALDDEDTSNWSAHHLTKYVAAKSKCERKITILSMVSS
ncbi:hypothetical protein HJC23_010812 [Cyclotella cryptica]|uniref:PDZ domain-containing protein n=1 Tax=Cyclotella cryptica TaxID=29204 RepID=A0ABD3QR24_9STRA|eukprot:CCRYP_003566-RA/>CCRYP_003566-RA protein AED:0.26 eAED:0.26 QI:374/1/1/1/1/1/7/120/1247